MVIISYNSTKKVEVQVIQILKEDEWIVVIAKTVGLNERWGMMHEHSLSLLLISI
jgi:23S rRNA-/tRNA-specific pseudouridylate synthase